MSDIIEKCMILLKSCLNMTYVNTIYCFLMAKKKIRKSVSYDFSSYMYYKTKEEQICSIFNNIICCHYFADGNKRISVIILISYAYQAI